MTKESETEGRMQPRAIRVFVSSTFMDMHAEREELVKRVFPRLRKLCEEREVDWSEVDLRWGISEEQRAEGAVLPICLAEIQRCRPYFLGLLGERYGWVPQRVPRALVDDEPWLDVHRGRSVTELEILHGALNDPGMADHAFFYFRDPSYLDRLPPGAHREEFWSAESESAAKLAALKERIRRSDLPLHENYPDPQALGALVLEDLTRVIDARFPADASQDPLDREAAEHEAFARSRTRVYVGGERYLDRLDAHLEGGGPPLVVLGESGAGKSALLANWAANLREVHPDAFVLTHFVGATPSSSDWASMLRRVLGELQRAFGFEAGIPTKPHELRQAFRDGLEEAATRADSRPLVLIIDALEKFEEGGGARELAWLPAHVPSPVRVVLSTLPGRPLDVLTERGWPTLTVKPLTTDERRELIVRHLARVAKALEADLVARLAAAPATASPLYLRALLEELRVHGGRRTLPERITYYLEAPTIADLFARILARFEEDYETERTALVKDAMSFLWASRGGLSEAELLDLLGPEGRPLPQAYWSPLYLAAEEALLVRSGKIGFFHDHLREAVRARYLPTEEARRSVHRRLAAYFGAREIGPRRIDEQPWQLAKAGAWADLRDLLADLAFVPEAVERDGYGVQAYWARVEAEGGFRMVDAYRVLLESPSTNMRAAWNVAALLGRMGDLAEAVPLWERILPLVREQPDPRRLGFALGNLASVLTDLGDYDRAIDLLEEQERFCRRRQDGAGIVSCLSHQARILEDQGELRRALLKREEQERLSDLLGDRTGKARALGGRVSILRALGRHDEAMPLLETQERLSREEGSEGGGLSALATRAALLEERGDIAGALALHGEAEAVFRRHGQRGDLASCLVNRARLLWKCSDLDAAERALEECGHIAEETGSRTILEAWLWGVARVLAERGRFAEALDAYGRQEALCREIGLADHLQACLNGQAFALSKQGDFAAALERLEEQETICRTLSDEASRCGCLQGQGAMLAKLGERDRASAAYEACEALALKLGNRAMVRAAREGIRDL